MTQPHQSDLERERHRLVETDEHIADREQRVDVLRLLIERMTMNRQDSAAARLTLGGLEHQLEDWYDHRQLICERIRFLEYGNYRSAAAIDRSPDSEK